MEEERMKILSQLYVSWFKMGLFTFGGGYAMLPMIQKEVIEKYHWATEEEIMEYYAIGQCTPGIIAVNTATFVGYYQKGVLGAIAATLGVVSPSFIIIGIIASLISNFSELEVVQHDEVDQVSCGGIPGIITNVIHHHQSPRPLIKFGCLTSNILLSRQ